MNENSMKEKIEGIVKKALDSMNTTNSLDTLNEIRVAVLGKKGQLTAVLKGMKDVPLKERPKVGQMVNDARSSIAKTLKKVKEKLERDQLEQKLAMEVIDVTLPAKKAQVGKRHPNSITLEKVEQIFIGMGYEVIQGPEVEYALYNFEKLNIPANHPAKDEQDTFYITKNIVLRTQTSPCQVRVMEQGKLPIRML